MSTRELVFEYRQKGAKSVAKSDRRVRESMQKTGRVANRESGKVERWMSRNRQAINKLATATLAAVGGILAASPTLRANLSGITSAFTLLADRIVRDVLPSGNSLTRVALDIATAYRDLSDPIRTAISRFIVFAGMLAVALKVAGPVIGILTSIAGVVSSVVGAFSFLAGAIGTAVTILATILGVSAAVAAGIAVLAVAAVALATALIFNIGGARDKTIAFMTQMYVGVRDRLMNLLNIARIISALFMSAVTKKIRDTKDRVLVLLSIGRQMAQRGKEWVGGLIRGVKDRVSDLVSAFRDMATQAANAFRAAFNRIIPDSVSIPRVSISIPNILGGGSVGVGGGSIDIPQLNTGGRISRDGLAMLHAGERVVPAAQVRERGPQPVGGGTTVQEVNITVQAMGDDARMTGRNIAQEFQRELEDRGA